MTTRRSFLKFAGLLIAAAAVPLRALADFIRPEAAFKATALEQTMAALGIKAEDSDLIEMGNPPIAENGSVVSVDVTSKIPGTSAIYIMVEKNPNPLCAVFAIPEGTEPTISTRIKVSQTCDIYGVVEANGKFYQAKKETKVTLGGCGG
jgi:sulfur-oxidizing protein SoxY